jgi:secondary thiamine-phosphate synthase enzyme
VAVDLETIFSGLVGDGGYRHSMEGADDMSAHAKSSILGASLLLPIRDGSLLLGTWQGIYLCEHRESGGTRRMAVTLIGE